MFPLYDNIPSTRLPIVTATIIVLNFLVQIWTAFMPVNEATRFEYTYAFIPARIAQLRDERPIEVPIQLQMQDRDTGEIVVAERRLEVPADRGAIVTSLFTAIFLHAGWMHLLGNMWFLWIFGDNVEDRLGHLGYLVFYFVGGLFANGCHWLSDPGSTIPVVGASGAIAAVLGAYAITWPHARVHTLIVLVIFITLVDIPAWIMLGFWFLTQVFSVASNSDLHGGVAFWAHIGGFVAGVGMMALFGRGQTPSEPPPPEIQVMNFPQRY